MGNKFLITLCLAVLLQDSIGSLANRSYNPRFRNVNKKYLKAASENGFEDREIAEEMLSNADVILVSLPEENSANELPAYHKENRNHHNQHKPQKPNHSSLPEADSPIIHQNKPVVLQLLGWSGNPPAPIAMPPLPAKESDMEMSKPDKDNIAVPIVIKEELKPESSMAGLDQENKQEWSQKPEAMPVVVVEEKIMNEEPMEMDMSKPSMDSIAVPIVIKEELKPEAPMVGLNQENKQEWSKKPEAIPVVVVEEKIMNEEPSILVEELSEDKKETSASEKWEKPTEIKKEEATIMLDSISETAPLIIEPISKPVPEIIEIEDKKEASKTKPQKIEDAIIADMKTNLFGAGIKNKESASNADQEPTVVFDLIPENLLVMSSDASIPEVIDGENKKESSEPKIKIISEKIIDSDKMKIQNEKINESAAAISEIMSEANKESMALGEEIKIAMQPEIPESILIVDSVSDSKDKMESKPEEIVIQESPAAVILEDKMESKPQEIAMPVPIELVLVENSAAEYSSPMMAENKDKMESKPEEIVIQESPVAVILEDNIESKLQEIPMPAPIEVAVVENSAAENASPMVEWSKPQEIAMPASPVAEISFPVAVNKDKMESKPEEISMASLAPIEVAVKESSVSENSFPMMTENKDKFESKPEEIAMQVPHKVVMKENSVSQSSSPIFQSQIVVESKLDSKIPDEKLKPSEKLPQIQESNETQVKKTEVPLTEAAKPTLSGNPEKVIEAENSLVNNTRRRRPGKPIKKPGKKPAGVSKPKPQPTVAATTVAPTTVGINVGLGK